MPPLPRDFPVLPADATPVSETQRRFLIAELLQADALPALQHGYMLLPPELDIERLRRSFRYVAQLQEMLRTRFSFDHRRILQYVDADLALDMAECQFDGNTAALHAGLLDGSLLRSLHPSMRAFGTAPLARVTLLRARDRGLALALSVHHGIFDGMSSLVLSRQLLALYGSDEPQQMLAELRGRCTPYRQFVEHERVLLDGEGGQALIGFWRAYLDGVPLAPAAAATAMGESEIVIAPAQLAPLNLLCRRHAVTLHLLLLASFQLALAWHSGERDVLTLTPTKNRPTRFAETIGCFVNPVLVRNQVDLRRTLLDNVLALRAAASAAYRHAHAPLSFVSRGVFPQLALGLSPLQRNWFSIQLGSGPTGKGEQFVLEHLRAERMLASGHSLLLQSCAQELRGHFASNSAIDADGAAAGAFRTIVAMLVGQPDCTLEALFDRLDEQDGGSPFKKHG